MMRSPDILGSSMRRREFITLLGGAAAMWPQAASAQEVRRQYRIAIIGPRTWQSFLDELAQAGFVEGRNLEIDGRGIGVATASYEAIAVELTKARPDVFGHHGPCRRSEGNDTVTYAGGVGGIRGSSDGEASNDCWVRGCRPAHGRRNRPRLHHQLSLDGFPIRHRFNLQMRPKRRNQYVWQRSLSATKR